MTMTSSLLLTAAVVAVVCFCCCSSQASFRVLSVNIRYADCLFVSCRSLSLPLSVSLNHSSRFYQANSTPVVNVVSQKFKPIFIVVSTRTNDAMVFLMIEYVGHRTCYGTQFTTDSVCSYLFIYKQEGQKATYIAVSLHTNT